MATGKAIIYKGIPYFSDVKVPTRVSQLANDAGYLTTDEKVKQTPNTTSLYSHPILFSASDDNGEVVGGTYKNPDFYYNPNLNRMIFKNGGGIEVRSGTTNVSILSYIHLSDLTDACSIMNITTEDIELDDVTYQGITYSNTWDGTHHSLKDTIGSLKQLKHVPITTSTATFPSTVSIQGDNYYQKVGRLVIVIVNLKIVSSTKGWHRVTNYIPNIVDRPIYNIPGNASDGDADGIMQPFNITSQGVLEIYNTKTGTTYCQGSIVYFANDLG